MFLTRLLKPTITASAHCDLPCGIYDPEQARIEAESCYKIIEKYNASSDEQFKTRAILIKEVRLTRIVFDRDQLALVLAHEQLRRARHNPGEL